MTSSQTPPGQSKSPTFNVEAFRTKIRTLRPKCELCSFVGHSIVAHLREEHKMTVGQYQKKFPTAPVISPAVQAAIRLTGKERYLTSASDEQILLAFVPNEGWKEQAAKFEKRTKAYGTDILKLVPPRDENFEFGENRDHILFALTAGWNYLVTGPTGAGKTEEILQTMNRIGMPIQRANMHGDVTYRSFIGVREAGPTGTYFREGLLPTAMRGGYPILLDELDFTPPAIAAVMFPVLERSRTLYIPETGETLKALPGFTVFGTGNTGGKGDEQGRYTGTEVLNTALLDRFGVKTKADYLKADVETRMLTRIYPRVKPAFISTAVKLANELRTAFKGGDLEFSLSTRKLREFTEAAQALGTKKALELALLNWLDKDDVNFVNEVTKRVGMLTTEP